MFCGSLVFNIQQMTDFFLISIPHPMHSLFSSNTWVESHNTYERKAILSQLYSYVKRTGSQWQSYVCKE